MKNGQGPYGLTAEFCQICQELASTLLKLVPKTERKVALPNSPFLRYMCAQICQEHTPSPLSTSPSSYRSPYPTYRHKMQTLGLFCCPCQTCSPPSMPFPPHTALAASLTDTRKTRKTPACGLTVMAGLASVFLVQRSLLAIRVKARLRLTLFLPCLWFPAITFSHLWLDCTLSKVQVRDNSNFSE